MVISKQTYQSRAEKINQFMHTRIAITNIGVKY